MQDDHVLYLSHPTPTYPSAGGPSLNRGLRPPPASYYRPRSPLRTTLGAPLRVPLRARIAKTIASEPGEVRASHVDCDVIFPPVTTTFSAATAMPASNLGSGNPPTRPPGNGHPIYDVKSKPGGNLWVGGSPCYKLST